MRLPPYYSLPLTLPLPSSDRHRATKGLTAMSGPATDAVTTNSESQIAVTSREVMTPIRRPSSLRGNTARGKQLPIWCRRLARELIILW